MRIHLKQSYSQLKSKAAFPKIEVSEKPRFLNFINSLFFILFLMMIFSCTAKKEEAPVIPPETSPLSGNYIGFGVITDSFTHISVDPEENSESLGYLRRGSLVKIIKRQILRVSGGYVTWVLIDGDYQGWLREEVMDIYRNEGQAMTASELAIK